MEQVINEIIKRNTNLFGDNPKIEKINVGFTNTIYNINNKYIVKICTDVNNEENLKKEIHFYEENKDNNLIPILYFSSVDKKDIPYLYKRLAIYDMMYFLKQFLEYPNIEDLKIDVLNAAKLV